MVQLVDRRSALILALESTCDETAAAVVRGGREVLSNIVASQHELHARFRGVVPEIASRAHMERMNGIIDDALRAAGVSGPDLSAVAVANRPGLIGCLIVSVAAAKALAWAWGKPLIGVDHIHAHALSAAIEHDVAFPAVCLVASGGHTALYHVADPLNIERLGATIDDAVGEAYDKVATMLGLDYPGGPLLDRLARTWHQRVPPGTKPAARFPQSLMDDDNLNFSFSGLKTSVLYHIHGPGKTTGGLERLTPEAIQEIAAAFQSTVVRTLIEKLRRAAERTNARSLLLGGGVACNSGLRAAIADLGAKLKLPVFIPHVDLCTDNAAMSAALAWHLLMAGKVSGLDLQAQANSADTRAKKTRPARPADSPD